MIKINTPEEIEHMREACSLVAEQMTLVINDPDLVVAGTTTEEIDGFIYIDTLAKGCTPATLGYKGYPKSSCISINHVACHGIPSDKKLKVNDILNIDLTLKTEGGYHGDTSVMFNLTKRPVDDFKNRLCEVTQKAMYAGIRAIKPGAPLNNIGKAIEEYANSEHLYPMMAFTGHGINTIFHDLPPIYHYYVEGDNAIMEPGMIFTVEPILSRSQANIKILNDGWTAMSQDKALTAQWEHTILITETGYDILTYREDDEIDKEG